MDWRDGRIAIGKLGFHPMINCFIIVCVIHNIIGVYSRHKDWHTMQYET